VHQQALRGVGLIELERGDRAKAKAQYERLLGRAAMGRGACEHWAHADYGWLLFLDGDLPGARQHLEEAVRMGQSGAYITDSQLSEHLYRLGEVYWALGGETRQQPQFALRMFMEAAKVEGHAQASALVGLGRYYEGVAKNGGAAAALYRKAVALDPSVSTAGIEALLR
ncbi:hypothetical protein H632_c4508p0, partial [Helicosporidium sp. ATCC 50920]